jgi:hypothetical protein
MRLRYPAVAEVYGVLDSPDDAPDRAIAWTDADIDTGAT